jgi:uncharacterized protein (TIGR03435 family)
MLQLAETLQRLLGQPVWDHTGLAGNYHFAFRYARDDASDTGAPTLATALKESLGLQLEKQKGPVETLVVDRIDRTPAETSAALTGGSSIRGLCADSSRQPPISPNSRERKSD